MNGIVNIARRQASSGGGAAPNPDFVSTWDTTQAGSASDTIVLPMTAGPTVHWGDGNSDTTNTHTYASGGTYTVTIEGAVNTFRFANSGDRRKITDVSNWGGFDFANNSTFLGCSNLDISATDSPTLSTTSLANCFKSCISLTTPDFSSWDTSGITSMETMFEGATNFNGDITTWDTSNVTKFNRGNTVGMFSNCRVFNQNINSWDITGTNNTVAMFSGCYRFNQPLNNWDLSNVTNANSMFNGCTDFNQDLSNWDVSNITNFSLIFRLASNFSSDISAWDTSKATSFNQMFAYAVNFNAPIGLWNTSLTTNIFKALEGATSFDQNLANWDVNQITNMSLFMSGGGGVSTANYDALLIAWDAQGAMSFSGTAHFGSSQYTSGGAAETARTSLIAKWGGIIDGGAA